MSPEKASTAVQHQLRVIREFFRNSNRFLDFRQFLRGLLLRHLNLRSTLAHGIGILIELHAITSPTDLISRFSPATPGPGCCGFLSAGRPLGGIRAIADPAVRRTARGGFPLAEGCRSTPNQVLCKHSYRRIRTRPPQAFPNPFPGTEVASASRVLWRNLIHKRRRNGYPLRKSFSMSGVRYALHARG